MSDRNARPEWRAAFLNRTATRRTTRAVANADVTTTDMTPPNPTSRTPRIGAIRRAGRAAPARRGDEARAASLALPIAAMLRLLPTT